MVSTKKCYVSHWYNEEIKSERIIASSSFKDVGYQVTIVSAGSNCVLNYFLSSDYFYFYINKNDIRYYKFNNGKWEVAHCNKLDE